jgi:hypothetical protein
MKALRFLSRVAIICNFFFILTVALHFNSFLEEQAIVSTVVIIGYALAVFVFTPLVIILYFAFIIFRKKLFDVVPKWMVITNFVFLLLQILYILLFLNGSFYN